MLLWKYVQRFDYPAETAQQSISDLQLLALDSIPTAELAVEALDLALALNLTGYAAGYAALAVRLAAPLATAEAELAQKL
jgi:predicted nucleic acid-binding protein